MPLQPYVQRRGSEPADWLLVIQREGASLRWSLLDPLGIPLARQQLRDGAWQADGLLRPNPARELFAALLFALTERDQLAALYGAAAEQPVLASVGCAVATTCAGRSAIARHGASNSTWRRG